MYANKVGMMHESKGQHIQENKNIKNVKRCRDGMPKSMQTRIGMMHESKGQHIGKAPSLHLFHTEFSAWESSISRLGMRLKPCHVFLQHNHKSVLTVAPLLYASGTT